MEQRWKTGPKVRLNDNFGYYKEAIEYSDLTPHPKFRWINPALIPSDLREGL